MICRKVLESEIPQALDLVWKVFEEFEAPEYVEEGIQTFKSFIELANINACINSGEMDFWGYESSGKIVGVIATRNTNHICLLFVDKEFQRQGIAKALLQIVIQECQLKDEVKISVNSSPCAVNVYRRFGFIELDLEQISDGIRFTPMEMIV